MFTELPTDITEEERKSFYKKLFRLNQEPSIHTQCCDDDPTKPNSCEGLGLASAQKNLDSGIPVVLENFGRRVEEGDYKTSFGQFFLTDMITVYIPGEKIDPEFLKKCRDMNKSRQNNITPISKRLSDEEKERLRKLHIKALVKNI